MDDVRLSEWLTSQKLTRLEVREDSRNTPNQSGDIKETVVIQCAVGAIIQPGESVKEKSEQVLS